MDQNGIGMEVGLGPGHIVLDGDPVPPPKTGDPKNGEAPNFSVHVIVIVILLEHCTFVIGMFTFKF